jgi:hypothetical protein
MRKWLKKNSLTLNFSYIFERNYKKISLFFFQFQRFIAKMNKDKIPMILHIVNNVFLGIFTKFFKKHRQH